MKIYGTEPNGSDGYTLTLRDYNEEVYSYGGTIPAYKSNITRPEIVNISRAFLDTNGAHQETTVAVTPPAAADNYFAAKAPADIRQTWREMLSDLNVCSQKGLVERFDASIGAGSVTMPYGGQYQATETQAMIAKLPVAKGHTDCVTMMAYGFDPYLSSWSPYHGASYAVVDSVAKITASGGDWTKSPYR